MRLTEWTLYRLARAFYRSEVAHSDTMKASLQSWEGIDDYRRAEMQKILAAAKRYGVGLDGKRLLDLGCGDGAITVQYLTQGASSVVGVDIDPMLIRRARKLHHDTRARFVLGTDQSIPVEANSVDVAISYDVFEHLGCMDVILSELHRVLVPGARMLIGTWSWRHPFAPHLWAVMPVPWAHLVVSEKTLLRACRRVYESDWYVPNVHDVDDGGARKVKYTEDAIPTSYLNKFLIREFEQAFRRAGFSFQTHAIPFGSSYAQWTRPFVRSGWGRELLSGYVWFVVRKSQTG